MILDQSAFMYNPWPPGLALPQMQHPNSQTLSQTLELGMFQTTLLPSAPTQEAPVLRWLCQCWLCTQCSQSTLSSTQTYQLKVFLKTGNMLGCSVLALLFPGCCDFHRQETCRPSSSVSFHEAVIPSPVGGCADNHTWQLIWKNISSASGTQQTVRPAQRSGATTE